MAANTTTGLRALRSLTATACAACRRPFSHTARALAAPQNQDKPSVDINSLLGRVDQNFNSANPNLYSNLVPGQGLENSIIRDWEEDDRHKLNIYATKHNTHITLAKPNRDSLISVSCGN